MNLSSNPSFYRNFRIDDFRTRNRFGRLDFAIVFLGNRKKEKEGKVV